MAEPGAGLRIFGEHEPFSATRGPVLCSDPLPLDAMGTLGGGLCSRQIVQGLQSPGFDVVCSMSEHSCLSRTYSLAIPAAVRRLLWNNANRQQIMEVEKPDVIVFTEAAPRCLPDAIGIPPEVDFHGPDIIEFEQKVRDSQAGVRQADYRLSNRPDSVSRLKN